MSSSEAMASTDASQLGGLPAGASSSADGSSDESVCMVRIGSFNVGVAQEQLTSDGKIRGCLHKVENIIAGCVQDAGIHIMNLCELGGYCQGLPAAGIYADNMEIFQGPEAPRVAIDCNYLTAWGFDADTTQFGMKTTEASTTHWLTSETCQPKNMVVHKFHNDAGLRLTLGNLHIRIPHNHPGVSSNARQRIVREALKTLEFETPIDSATQPVVLVLVGDCNLDVETAEEAVQPLQPAPADANYRTVWCVHNTEDSQSGDLIFVKGAYAWCFDLPFGKAHDNRGVRNDNHNAIGIELRVIVDIEPKHESKRPKTGPAAQPVPVDDGAAQPVPEQTEQPERQPEQAQQPERQPERQPSQPERQPDQPERQPDQPDALVSADAKDLEKQIRQFFESRGSEAEAVHRDVRQLRTLLFRKQKYAVHQDLWIPGAPRPGAKQHVEAVVSEVLVLQQLKGALQIRETWLRQQGLPQDCQMRDKERKDFLQWAKDKYHAEEYQRNRHQEDIASRKSRPLLRCTCCRSLPS